MQERCCFVFRLRTCADAKVRDAQHKVNQGPDALQEQPRPVAALRRHQPLLACEKRVPLFFERFPCGVCPKPVLVK